MLLEPQNQGGGRDPHLSAPAPNDGDVQPLLGAPLISFFPEGRRAKVSPMSPV